MKKKILALLLSTLMVFSTVNTFAVAEEPVANAPKAVANDTATDDNGLELNKTLNVDKDGNYSITLESYTTGSVKTTTSVKPTDIVLVLDQSGSMKEEIPESNGTTRQAALKKSVTDFIEKISEQNADHRIAIVTFASDSNILSLTGGITNAQSAFYRANENETELTTVISNLTANGATRADLGMDNAKSILDAYGYNDGREKMIVFFSDGRPSDGDSFDEDVATDAIETATSLKGSVTDNDGVTTNKNVKVYVIGMQEDADPNVINNDTEAIGAKWEDNDAIDAITTNRYFNFLSSNSTNATSIGVKVSYEWRFIIKQYYWEINATYEWSNKGYYHSAENSAELNDAFTNIFESVTTPAISLGSETVLKDVLSDYFELPVGVTATDDIKVQTAPVTAISEDGTYTFGTPVYSYLTPTVDGKTISVKGFDYDKNVVVKDNETEKVSGSKLIVTIPVEPIDGFIGGNQVPSNTVDSGIYNKDGGKVEAFEIPTADIPINFSVSVDDLTIYRGNNVAINEVFSLAATTGGLCDDFVNITTSIKGPSDNVMSDNLAPTDCTDYTLNWTITPKYSGTVETESNSKSFTIHVLQPTLTVQDLWVDYGTTINGDDYVTCDYETTCDCGAGTISTVSGIKPSLYVEYTDEFGDVLSATNLPSTSNNTVNAKLLIGSDTTTGIKDQFNINLNTYDLEIIKNVSKADWENFKQDMVFDVTYTQGTTDKTINVVMNTADFVPVGANYTCTKTIKNLYSGIPVNVEEQTDWSWRYTPDGGATRNVSVASNPTISTEKVDLANEQQVSYTNTLKNTNWTSLIETIQNIFEPLLQGGRQ